MTNQGLTTVELPHATYEAETSLAGEIAATNNWLSTARPLIKHSQWAAPVVILKAPGYNKSSHPKTVRQNRVTALQEKYTGHHAPIIPFDHQREDDY